MLGCRYVVKMTNIEGRRYGVNGERCVAKISENISHTVHTQ